MAQSKTVYVCENCGYETSRWLGQCPDCGEWNSLSEKAAAPVAKTARISSTVSNSGNAKIQRLSQIDTKNEPRYKTGMKELDRVLGGGIVKGSLVLLGGDPGIGKSTILLQICEYIGKSMSILYVSGEESARQLKLRATRLGVSTESLMILTDTDCESVIECIKLSSPDFVVIDSIQTMCIRDITSLPGSIVQVRECTNALMHCAKGLDIPIFLVGHVNKDGAIAGPKVLEHIVDCVLYFEGDKQLSYRILRAVKNRYGSTNEIGVFEMQTNGLKEVANPSLLLLSGRPVNVSGTCVASVMEGSRPILAEVQGLAASSAFGNPRRMSTGFDYNRMALILAVLEKKAGFYFSGMDVYVNIVGGLRLDEPAADLPVALSLISSLKDIPVAEDIIAFGEIGLAGELRSASSVEARIREAARLGLKRCILPKQNMTSLKSRFKDLDIELIGCRTVREAAEALDA